MKKKKPRPLGPHAQKQEPFTWSVDVVDGQVVIGFSKTLHTLRLPSDVAIGFANTVGARARDAHLQRLEMELSASKQRIAELESTKKPTD